MHDADKYWQVYDWIRNAFPYDSDEQIERKIEEYINRSRQGDASTSPDPKHNTT